MIIKIIALIVATFYFVVKLRYELQMFQQNSYRNERYFKWLKKSGLIAIRYAEIGSILLAVVATIFSIDWLLILSAILLIVLAIGLLKRKSKVKLKFTSRAKRLFFTSLGVAILIVGLIWFLNSCLSVAILFAIVCGFLTFLILPLANIILKPVENRINNWYINDAKRILAEHKDLIIIGITGSYGKTSTKHFLEKILSQKYNVLMTPGSFNTTMGVVRTIREYLNPTHQVFICEMGAKQNGDIKEICDIVKPKYGILTSVAEQHLDTFKNIENVRKTKFELVDSLPSDGLAVLNADYDIIVSNADKVKTNTIFYSLNSAKQGYTAKNITYSQHGTTFDLYIGENREGTFTTELLGDYNVSNILACMALAYEMGLNDKEIAFGVHKLQAVEHRMEIKPNGAGLIIIDDAFNSNPKGAEMALKILSQFTGKRFVITPGIIELAGRQDYYNEKLGEQIAQSVDYAVLVGKKQTEAIYKGLKNKNYPDEQIFIANNLKEAAEKVFSMAVRGDTVLFENDLPDLFG